MQEIEPLLWNSQIDLPMSKVAYPLVLLTFPFVTIILFPTDPHAEEKTLWIQAKRTVLAILRVQPGKDLVESLMQPVTDEHELLWEEVLENEMEADHKLRHPRRMPSSTAQEAYRLDDIRSYV